MGVYLVHHPLHNFSPEVGGGRLHGNARLQGTLQYFHLFPAWSPQTLPLHCSCGLTWTMMILKDVQHLTEYTLGCLNTDGTANIWLLVSVVVYLRITVNKPIIKC